jgi:alanine dehydrogenase
MPSRSVFVDVAIDQGGCGETSHVTSHDKPTYVEERVVHYAVPNIPALVPWTSTIALTNVTMPYVRELALRGLDVLQSGESALRSGVNVHDGRITVEAIAEAVGLPFTPLAVSER